MVTFRSSLTVIAILVLFSCAISAQAQSPKERRSRIQTALDQRDSGRALAELQAFRTAVPDQFTANNFDYLLGRVAERKGDLPTASAGYQSVAARKSLLTQYAYWHLAQIARATGDLPREREYLRMLMAAAPNSLLRPAANRRLAQSYFESGDYATVVNLLKPAADATRDAQSREALAGIARSYLAMGQKDQARSAFTELLTRLPNPAQPDDLALEAARALDQMDGGTADRPPQLVEQEHLRRAIIYHFNRHFAEARLHYAEIIKRFPQSANVADALYQTGRGYYSERQYEQAFANLQRVADQYPSSINASDAVNFAAGALARLKRTDEAVIWYKRAIDNFPTAPTPERPWLNLIDALRDAGRDAEALKWADDAQRRFAGQPAAGQALFSRARIHFQAGDWNAALADFAALRALPSLPGMNLPGGTSFSELSFLQGFALEQLGRFDDAITTYSMILDGRNEYYGGRATLRLQALASDPRTRDSIIGRRDRLRALMNLALSGGRFEPARVAAQDLLRLTADAGERAKLLEVLRRCYAALPAYAGVRNPRLLSPGRTELLTSAPPITADPPSHRAVAAELLFLGLHDEGSVELATADGDGRPFNDGSPDAGFTLATFYGRGDQANNAVRYAEPLWKALPADYVVALAPRPMIQLLYPVPYTEPLLAHARPRGVDPRLVLSIARQESRYRPDVKSYAAARGLMQFISATADQIAAEIPRPGFKQDDLYNPSIAIQFGSQYMADLFRLFPGQPQAVAASYNGGEDNVARWVARSHSTDPDRYVCEIAVSQSKDYVFKVIANYRVYQTLYDENLNPR
jgi:soluble lytic murein transglycosylase